MKSHISKKQLRDFGYLIAFCFPIIIGLIVPFIFGHDFKSWTLYVSLPSLILGVVKPSLLLYPYKFWMLLGKILGWINSRLILSMIFFLVLIPISLLMKIFGYDPLRKLNKDLLTYKEKKYNHKIDLTKIF